MSESSIRIKAKISNEITKVRARIRHPMETGFRLNQETNQLVPAHYIKTVTVQHNDKLVISCDWSRAVSKNPYFEFEFEGAHKGDRIRLSWHDTQNMTDSIETIIT